MPGAANNNGFDARRFAALMAGFDTGNACEAEAMNKARAMRRMVAAAGLRFVDVMERADVKQALDDQMEPVREESRELQEARKEAAVLREELTERIRDVRKLAELLTVERNNAGELRRELAVVSGAGKPFNARPAPAPDSEPVNGGLVAVVVVIVVTLLVASTLRSENLKGRRTDNELGLAKHKRNGAALVQTNRGVLPVSKPHRLPRGVRRGGAPGDGQPIRKFPEPSAERMAGTMR